MRTGCILFFTVTALTVQAQQETLKLVTDRPDQTESSAVVPFKSFQFETGFIMENNETDLLEQQSFAYNTTLLRYGVLKNFELRLGFEYLGEKTKTKNTGSTQTLSGAGPLFTGFKVKIAEEAGWVPEMAFLGALVLPITSNDDFMPQYTASSMRFAFSHTLSERLSLGYNLGAEWDGESAAPGYYYSVALGIGITDKLGMFVESYGTLKDGGNSENLLDAGFTYLISPNLQLDASGGIGINEKATDNFVSLGLSYRYLKQ